MPRPSARTRTRSSGSPEPASSSATVPRSRARRRARSSRSSRPSARAASVARIADEKYGPGNTAAPHLLLHDHRVDHAEAETAALLGNEHAGPSEVDDLAPHLGGDAGVVVLGHLAARTPSALPPRGTLRTDVAQRSCSAENVKSIRAGRYREPDANVSFVDFAWSAEDLAFKEELEAFLDKEMRPFLEQWADDDDLERVARRHGRDGQAQGVAAQAERRSLGRDPVARGVGRPRRDHRAVRSSTRR